MAIRINENILSLFVNRNLLRNSDKLENTYRHLSSGEKITLAGDDQAGLANSQVLRAKIQGLQRNIMNANEGLNLLSVAESSLDGVTELLQRLRELAVQASTDTMSDEQRGHIQVEVRELLEEIDRLATTADYNGRNLLDGSFQGLRFQLGTRKDESIIFSIEDARTTVLGSTARATGALEVSGARILGNGDLTINGVNIPASDFDEVSTVEGEASAIAKARAINDVTHLTGVTAEVAPAVWQDATAGITGGVTLDGTTTALFINGINIGEVSVTAGDADGFLRQRINASSQLTGVTASLGPNGELVLTAEDGRNVALETRGGIADELGLSAADGDLDTTFRGKITLNSSDTIQLGGDTGLIGFAAGQATTFVNFDATLSTMSLATVEQAQDALAALDVALTQILQRRAALGAIENRLTAAIDDLMVSVENLSNSDSRIRDADFAVETANMTQQTIIQEAGIAILSQANVVPKMALELLRS